MLGQFVVFSSSKSSTTPERQSDPADFKLSRGFSNRGPADNGSAARAQISLLLPFVDGKCACFLKMRVGQRRRFDAKIRRGSQYKLLLV